MQKKKFTARNGLVFEIERLGAETGSAILLKLSRVYAAGLRSANPIGTMLHHIVDTDFVAVCDTFARVTRVRRRDGKEPLLSDVFDEIFSGEYDAMFEWLEFAVTWNFESFFVLARIRQDESLTRAQSAASSTDSPLTSTGT